MLVLSCGFGHIYWRNPQWKTSFFCVVRVKVNQPLFVPAFSLIQWFSIFCRIRYNFLRSNGVNGDNVAKFTRAEHCVKSVRIRSYSGPHFPAFGLNTDQNNSEYGHFFTQWNVMISFTSRKQFIHWRNWEVNFFQNIS